MEYKVVSFVDIFVENRDICMDQILCEIQCEFQLEGSDVNVFEGIEEETGLLREQF